jgi:hypothetical protein
MKRIIIAAALTFAATAAQAQNLYLDSHSGTQPFIYGSQPAPESVQSFDWNFRTPSVPDVSQGVGQGAGPWGTAIPSGPSGYPCTLPGCR